jgi:hypothetical protein
MTPYFVDASKRQMPHPKIPHPAWDYNWDGSMTFGFQPESVSTCEGLRESKVTGKTRGILYS